MTAYRILVANPYNQRDDWALFCSRLQDVFAPAIAESQPFTSCEAVHQTGDTGVRDFNLVIWMVPDRASSMCARHFHAELPQGHAGYTMFDNDLAISEVYYREETNAARRPHLAYHEAMHNVLRRGNTMHQRHGLAASTPDPTDRRHANDVLMGHMLRSTPAQWFGGFAVANQLANDLAGL